MAATFCIVVDREVVLSAYTCPLPKGNCYWAHRRTGQCRYTDQDLTPEQFAERVGTTVPTDAEIQAFTNKHKDEIND
jgi:hypothetical protein